LAILVAAGLPPVSGTSGCSGSACISSLGVEVGCFLTPCNAIVNQSIYDVCIVFVRPVAPYSLLGGKESSRRGRDPGVSSNLWRAFEDSGRSVPLNGRESAARPMERYKNARRTGGVIAASSGDAQRTARKARAGARTLARYLMGIYINPRALVHRRVTRETENRRAETVRAAIRKTAEAGLRRVKRRAPFKQANFRSTRRR